jgi:hypothetical protein
LGSVGHGELYILFGGGGIIKSHINFCDDNAAEVKRRMASVPGSTEPSFLAVGLQKVNVPARLRRACLRKE